MMFFFRPGHPRASPGGFVSAVDLADIPMDVPKALNAPIMAGRFYENTCAPDLEHTDIGSRERHREYMKQRGLTHPSDFTQEWANAEAERKKVREGQPIPDKERRELIGRLDYEMEKKYAKRR